MSKIEKLPSGSYRTRVRYTDESGKYCSKSFTAPTVKEVKKMVADFLSGKDEKKEQKFLLLSDAMRQYIQTKQNVLSPSTVRGYTAYSNLYALKLQKKNIYDITQADVQKAVSEEAATHSPKTTRNLHGFISAVIRLYRPEFTLVTTLPQKDASQIQIPTEDEVKAIIKRLEGNEAKIPVMLAAYQGMRMSEVVGLKWSCVDFDAHTIKIQEAKVMNADREYVSKRPKTVSGSREIKMMSVVEEALRNAPREGEYVTSLKGQQIFNRYRRAQKVIGKEYSFHELRHFACSLMISLGIPNKYIANFLGHSSERMVERVYGHVMKDKKDEFFDRVNSHFSGEQK